MRGNRHRHKGKEPGGKLDPMEEDNDEEEGEKSTPEASRHEDAMLAGLASIRGDIQSLKQDFQENFMTFKQELKQDMSTFQQEIDKKIQKSKSEIQSQKTTLTEAQTRIAELEEWGAEAGDTLTELRQLSHRLQEKVTDLEARSRRNNIRIFGLPEDTEGNDMIKYMDTFLRAEFQIQDGSPLQIQRAHRATGRKPPADTPPRSIVINFQQFEIKEMVIKKAWQKKVLVNGKQIWFDHDYPTEVVLKRKSYNEIKKKLKENGIRFQTPVTRMRIHWKDGVRTYESAREAALDMRERGYQIDVRNEPTATEPNLGWRRAGDRRSSQNITARAREILQDYRMAK